MDAASTPALQGTEAGVLPLPAELTIYHVGELHPAWRAWVESGGSQVDGSAVDQVDAAGLQLLLALARSTRDRGATLRFTTTSRALEQGCAALGLADWMARHAEGAAA